MKKRGWEYKRLFAALLTIVIVGVLVFSGPARAITVGIERTDGSDNPREGTLVDFSGQVDIHTTDNVNLKGIVVLLDDTPDDSIVNAKRCRFHLNKTPFEDNHAICNIAIRSLTSDYTTLGYGYGDAYGYAYKLSTSTLNTSNFSFNYGYMYGATSSYGYDAYNTALGSTSEIQINFSWRVPSVDFASSYNVALGAIAGESSSDDQVLFISRDVVSLSVQGVGGGGSSGGTSGGSTSSTPTSTTPTTITTPTTTTPTTTTPPGVPDVTETQQILKVVPPDSLGLDSVTADDVDISVIETVSETTNTVTKDKLEAARATVTDAAAKSVVDQISEALDKAESEQLEVQADLNVYEVTSKSTGKKSYVTKVTLSFTATDNMENVEIVEFIPKSVALDVSELVFTTPPTILQSDPIVVWNFPVVSAGETKDLSYVVNKQLTTKESTTLSSGKKVTVPEGTGDTTEDVCTQVITLAVDPATNDCYEFNTPCDVPDTFTVVDECPGAEEKIVSPGLKANEKLAIFLGVVVIILLVLWLFVYRRPGTSELVFHKRVKEHHAAHYKSQAKNKSHKKSSKKKVHMLY